MWHAWQTTYVYAVLVGRCEGNRPLGKPEGRWKYNTQLDIKETGSEELNWIHLAGCCENDIEH
jgi:hypothetical protein